MLFRLFIIYISCSLLLADDADTNRVNSDEKLAGDTVEKLSEDFYSFFVTDITGKDIPLDVYRGKISLVVNVASECGYTDGHYKALVQLQNDLISHGKFTVLAFPCNQFGAQEPGDNASILRFAQRNYNVNFPVFGKVNVLNNDVPDAWKYLIDKSGNAPNWNFWKYLVDERGQIVNSWGPWVSVEEIRPDILSLYNAMSKDDRSTFHGGEL